MESWQNLVVVGQQSHHLDHSWTVACPSTWRTHQHGERINMANLGVAVGKVL
jgi:hypothetical protein